MTLPCRAAISATLLAFAALFGGCSALPGKLTNPLSGKDTPPPVLRLEVEAPRDLTELLRDHLDLGRVNKLAAGEPLQEGELDRLIAAAPKQARELLDTEGYFNADIAVVRIGGGDGSALPVVKVTVEPGPRTLVGQVDLDVEGPLAGAAANPRAPFHAHARQTVQSLRDGWGLKVGEPFRNAGWSGAKGSGIAGLRAQGYVEADWLSTRARVDAATQRASLSATAGSGPLYRLGALRVEGLQVQDERTVRNVADLDPGAPATESTLLDIQERLQKTDLFDRASVSLEPDPRNPAQTPVAVRLRERKLQDATFGVGYGANVGARASVDYTHRRPFDQPWIARSLLQISQVEYIAQGELSTQTLPGLYRNFVSGTVRRVESDTDIVDTLRLRVGRAQETRRISRLLYLEQIVSETSSALGDQRSDALALHFHGIWRKVDDLLLPTRGHVWTGQFGTGYATADPGTHGPFSRLYAKLDAYRPIGDTWYGQGRIELGQVSPKSGVVVPDELRFRAGGDESVRGYAYRSLTTRVNGVEVGGEVLFTASAELARPILERLPQLWGAVFVDVGRAADNWRTLDPAVGVGVGVRFRSPVGPVKLDLAYGEEVRQFRLHLTVGVSF